jgi:sugar phosphate isomerase/epimerase
MYADDRSAILTVGQANDVCDALGSPAEVGIAVDVFHTWWDANLAAEIQRAGRHAGRLMSYHVCDWKTPTEDLLNDRGLMGEGCINLRQIRQWMDTAEFTGYDEVEIFSNRWWAADQHEYLQRIVASYAHHCV